MFLSSIVEIQRQLPGLLEEYQIPTSLTSPQDPFFLPRERATDPQRVSVGEIHWEGCWVFQFSLQGKIQRVEKQLWDCEGRQITSVVLWEA